MAVVEPLEERTFFTATVVGRHVFYNHSFFDRGHAAVGEADDVAIAPDKSALLPDQPITPDNYTGYSRGINGLMVDLAGLPSGGRLRAADFDFRVGNDANPSTWKPAPRPRRVSLRPLAGSEGVARATVTWRDRAIRNTWLRVTINADANTALAEPDVFYFGNLIGDTGDGGAVVDASDVELARSNLRQPAALQAPEDFDHNGRVTRADLRLARRNLGAALYTAAPFTTGVGAAISPPALPGNWRLIFHDEFAHAALDPVWHPAQYWDHDLTVVGGDELEAYDPSGLSTSDGVLHLTARRDAQHGVPYVSGLVMTGGEKALPASPKFSFLYGYLEVRAKLPAGRGLWPAVWMMPASYNDDNGEIDVVELLGNDPGEPHFSVHRQHGEEVHDWEGQDLSTDYHTFAVDWEADHVAWYVDGVERARTTDRSLICPEAMYPILDLAVGGAAGAPDATTVFPAAMNVDSVRVWQAGR